MPSMKVAVAQVQASALDVDRNVAATTKAIAEAAAQGAELVVLPELVASGYAVGDPGIRDLAEPGDGSGRVLSAWRAAAREHSVAIIGGYPERADDRLFNAVAVIDAAGEIAGGYRKLHLFGTEKSTFSPGDRGLPVFEIGGVTVGVAVCYDLRFVEVLRVLAIESGADLVAVPTAWVAGFDRQESVISANPGQLDGVLVQANLNQIYVACADLCGTDGEATFLGRSLIASPYGRPTAGPLDDATPAVAVAEVDVEEARRARDRGNGISPRQDRRPDVYALSQSQSTRTPAELLAEIERRRGYVLDLHRTLAVHDPDFLEHYDAFLDATFLAERTLDRRVKELVYVGALMAGGTEERHLAAHMRAAVANGATQREVLEVIEQVLAPAGVPRFIAALRAFEAAFPERD